MTYEVFIKEGDKLTLLYAWDKNGRLVYCRGTICTPRTPYKAL